MQTSAKLRTLLGFCVALVGACGESDAPAEQPDLDAAIASNDGSVTVDATISYDAGPDATLAWHAAETLSDITFLTVGGLDLKGDLYIPEGTGPFPVVVVVHGGGFSTGDKAERSSTSWSQHLQSQKIAAFSVNYRVYSDFSSGQTPYPGPLQDVKCSIMVLRARAATYRIRPDRIFILGGSAGGYFSNMVGVTGDESALNPPSCPLGAGQSNRVSGVVTFFGPSDWNALFSDPARVGSSNSESRLIGATNKCTTPAEQTGICASASATTHVDANDPPFFILHSDDDPVVPVTQGRLMYQTLMQRGVSARYSELSGKMHGWLDRFMDPEISAARDAITLWLKSLSSS